MTVVKRVSCLNRVIKNVPLLIVAQVQAAPVINTNKHLNYTVHN